jgi:hypothetical protein
MGGDRDMEVEVWGLRLGGSTVAGFKGAREGQYLGR